MAAFQPYFVGGILASAGVLVSADSGRWGRRGPGWDRAWKREEVWLFSCPDFLQQVETSQQGFSADSVPGCSGNLWMPRFFHRGPSASHAGVRFQ